MTAVLDLLPLLVAAWLLLAGVYGAVTSRDLLHVVLCVSVLHSSAWLFLVGLAARRPDGAAGTAGADPGELPADPLLHALTVRDIVVGVAVSALLLAFVIRIQRRFGTTDPDELEVLRG